MFDTGGKSAIVQVRNITFSYSRKQVLNNLDMTVNKGEILALIGPNGSGKSTLLRCINGFLPVNSGQILLDGVDIRRKSRRWISRHIAFLPQNLESVQHITVHELVAMGRCPHHSFGWLLDEEDRKMVRWAIEYMDLQSLQDCRVEKISGGERQRAWIAMILAQNTEIVLLDEPITYLDLKYQWNLIKIIKQVRSLYDKTFILVLHDINQALTVADRFIVMKNGRIQAHGRGQDIITGDLMRDVYGVNACVCHLDGFSQPVILPVESGL